MRFAVSMLASSDAAGWRAQAREAEAVGFDVLHLADHLVDGLPPPFTALAVAADATERIVVGNLVLAVDFRHPAVLAREAAMLSETSGGRFELGIGAGHMKREWDAVGIPFDPARVRVARLGEAVLLLRRLLAGEVVSFEGEHYALREHRCWPVPSTPPPILVGGNGDGVLRIAAEHADLVGYTGFGPNHDGSGSHLSHFTAAGLENRIAHVRRHAGGREVRANILVQLVAVTSDRRSVAADLASTFEAEVEDVLDSPFLLIGTIDEITEQVAERTERFGIDTWTVFAERPGVTEQTIATLAPVMERLRG